MDRLVQLLFYQGDADCFFIAQPRCSLGLQVRFGIIAAPCCGACIHCQASSLSRVIAYVVISRLAGAGLG